MRIILLIVVLLLLLSACSDQQTPLPPTFTPSTQQMSTSQPTGTPNPTSVPFQMYGQTLTDVTYCTIDNTPLKMDIYFPDSEGPWPVVVYAHGGSWIRGDKIEAAGFAQLMTSQGYAVVSINYRLYPTARYPAMIHDVKCAIRSLRANAAQFNLDPNRIAALGISAGGHLVALVGTSDQSAGLEVGEYLDQSSRVQAVVAMAPVTDLTRSFPNADIELMRQIGFGEDNIVQASPITHVSEDDPPFLLIHGDQDEVVPVEQSQLMYERLLEANLPAQLVIVRNGNHSLSAFDGSATPTLSEINQMIMNFLTQYLN